MNNYLNFARELKRLWNMRGTVIPVVVCALGTVQGLRKDIGVISDNSIVKIS